MSGGSIVAISRSVSDLARSEAFYCEGLGFRREGQPAPLPPTLARALGLEGNARRLTLTLGAQRLDLLAADGYAAPPPAAANDPAFQHIAIPVRDMDAAVRTLEQVRPEPITRGGPQVLPPSSGGVTAWKFRDPDGHAAELILFPAGPSAGLWRDAPGLFLGIDHSAITVTDLGGAIAFFERRFGFAVTASGLNRGPRQARLDGLDDPSVDVVSMASSASRTPHLELLHYRSPAFVGTAGASAVSATRLVMDEAPASYLPGPDGHGLLLGRDTPPC